MRLLIIRHAIAEDRAEFAASGTAVSDDARPLTSRGRARMKHGAKGLSSLLKGVDILASSPLRRAAQTAKIVARRVAVADVEIRDELCPDASPGEILEWLRARAPNAETIALVGHEPHLGRLVGWLISGRDRAPLMLKKGGACLLDVPAGERRGRSARPGGATLLWSLSPAQLRALGR